MNRQRQILIGAGACVIVSMLLIAAFSLGVYVGEHGWTRQGLTLQGPQRQPPAGGADQLGPAQPPGQQPGLPPGDPLPGGQPTLVGRVRLIMRDRLEVITPDGPRLIGLTPRTRLEDQGQAVELSALREGQVVAIFGRPAEGRGMLLADLIILLPPAEGQAGGEPRP